MDRKERFIVKNKAAFKKRYGADWERVLYATANKQFKEEHGAGEWGTNKLTDKYKNDTPGQEDAKVRTKKIVLKKRIDEATPPSGPKATRSKDEKTPPSGPKNPNKPHVGKTAHEKKVERYQQYLAKKKRDREQHLRNNPGLTQNRRRPVSQNAFYSKRAFRNQEISASYDPDVEQVEEARGSGYKLYHKSYTDAVKHAFAHHAKSGLRSSDDDKMHHIGLNSKKPGEGKTTSVNVPATHKSGKKHQIHIQVYNKGGSHPYELNTYSSTHRSMQEAKGDSTSSEYSKLMKQYGDMPMSKVPMKTRLKIRELGRKVRGDKPVSGLRASDLVDDMKRRQMGEAKGDSTSATIKVRGGDAVEIGMVKRGGKMQYYWKAKSGLKNVFDSPEKLRYSLRNTANFSGAEKAVAQLQKVYPVNEAKAEYEVKYSSSKRGPIKVTKFMSQDEAQAFLKKIRGEGMNGIVSKGGKPVREDIEQVDEARAKRNKLPIKVTRGTRKGKVDNLGTPCGGAFDCRGSFQLGKTKQAGTDTLYCSKCGRAKQRYTKPHKGQEYRTEEVEVAEAGMIGRTKPSRELNVQKFEKKYLGTKSLKDAKRAAHKAERKKGKQDVKINPTVDENVDAAKERVAQAKQRVMLAKQRLARSKARDLGNKRRKMANEAIKPAATLKDSGRQVVQTTAGRFQQKTLKKQAERSSQQAGRTQSRTSELAKKIKRRMRRKLRRPTTNR